MNQQNKSQKKIKILFLFFLINTINLSCNCKLKEIKDPMKQKSQKPGTVIILNGSSASGKSSIQMKIQELFEKPYIRLGIDNQFNDILPDYYGLGEKHPQGNFLEKDIRYVDKIKVDGHDAIKLIVGPIGQKVIKGMHQSIKSFAKNGSNVVVDYILYEKTWFPHLVESLEDLKVYYVGIKYPIETIEKREEKRSTSPVGHARSHYKTVHYYDNYDLVIDNPEDSAEMIAKKIELFISKNPEPEAFKNYSQLFENQKIENKLKF